MVTAVPEVAEVEMLLLFKPVVPILAVPLVKVGVRVVDVPEVRVPLAAEREAVGAEAAVTVMVRVEVVLTPTGLVTVRV
jgi:hypothetical protein